MALLVVAVPVAVAVAALMGVVVMARVIVP